MRPTSKAGSLSKFPTYLNLSDEPRSFRIRVLDVIKCPVTKDRELDGAVQNHDLGDVKVQRADLDGLLVTNLTGTARFVSEGNSITLLVDGVEAFGRIADDIRGARHTVNVTQLVFAAAGVPLFPKRRKVESYLQFFGASARSA